MSLTDNEVKIVTYIDQRFWETGGLVADELILQDCKVSQNVLKNAWKKAEFRQALIARGVDLTPETSKQLLTPTQVLLANMLMNTHDPRSIREKLELVNVSTQQYQAWLRQPGFSQYLRKRAESAFASTDFQAYQSLSKLVEEGDINGIKLFFEMRGIYNPKMQVEVNVEVVVMKLVEIVAKHVKDPEVLNAIATDLETIEMGQPAQLRSAI